MHLYATEVHHRPNGYKKGSLKIGLQQYEAMPVPIFAEHLLDLHWKAMSYFLNDLLLYAIRTLAGKSLCEAQHALI